MNKLREEIFKKVFKVSDYRSTSADEIVDYILTDLINNDDFIQHIIDSGRVKVDEETLYNCIYDSNILDTSDCYDKDSFKIVELISQSKSILKVNNE